MLVSARLVNMKLETSSLALGHSDTAFHYINQPPSRKLQLERSIGPDSPHNL